MIWTQKSILVEVRQDFARKNLISQRWGAINLAPKLSNPNTADEFILVNRLVISYMIVWSNYQTGLERRGMKHKHTHTHYNKFATIRKVVVGSYSKAFHRIDQGAKIQP